MGIPWKVGMLNTAHEELNICVVILLLSCNDACGLTSSSYCHHTKMHMGPPCSDYVFRTIIQR